MRLAIKAVSQKGAVERSKAAARGFAANTGRFGVQSPVSLTLFLLSRSFPPRTQERREGMVQDRR
jgi:hypothetical protein